MVLDLRHGILFPPVELLGQFTFIGRHHSRLAARWLIRAALPQTRALCVLRAGHVGELRDAVLGAALLIVVQLLDGSQILAEDAQPHLVLDAVGVAALVFDLEHVEQMLHLVERVVIVLLVRLLLGPLHGATVPRMHRRLVVALERYLMALLQPRLCPDLDNAATLLFIAINQIRIDARQSARDKLTRRRIDFDNSVEEGISF